MKIEGIRSLLTVPVSNIVSARVSQGAIALPVESAHYLYSHLKNIRGYAAPPNSSGYSLSRLRALDNLIERLKELGVEPVPAGKEDSGVLARMRQDLNQALSRTVPGYRGAPGLDAGLSFNYLL
ncbi:MAG: hypothetical protein LBQ61_05925 [Spirochaetales bacterium]|jgi:hypothetical protein|nr:hypothetical protein [Spirochaetales bacterium]